MKRFALVGISLVLLSGSAFGWVDKSDGNDVQSPLDIKRMGLKLPKGTPFGSGKPVQCRVQYWDDVTKEQVHNFKCYFDHKGNDLFDVWTEVEWDFQQGKLVGQWWRFKNGVPDQVSAGLKVTHNANTDTTYVKIPRKRLRGRAGHLRWAGYTWSNESPCPDPGFGCDDEAPNNGGSWKFEYH